MPPDDVIREDADGQPVSTEQQAEKKGKEPETETISKSELASLRRERDEARESERYWANLAKPGARHTEPEPEKDEADPDPANDTFVDDLSKDGLGALTKRGIPTTRAVREMIRSEAEKIAQRVVGQAQQKASTDLSIMAKYPELKDPNSDLFKQTRIEMQELIDLDPNAAKSPLALAAAAKAAKLTLAQKAPGRRSRNDDEDTERYDYAEEAEASRRLRADSQGADRGRPGREVLEDDDALTSQQREVISRMGITPKEFQQQRRELSGGRDSHGRFAGRR